MNKLGILEEYSFIAFISLEVLLLIASLKSIVEESFEISCFIFFSASYAYFLNLLASSN